MKDILKPCCFFSAGISAFIALIAMGLKMSNVVTNHDGWIFYIICMGMWLIFMVIGFAIRD